MASEAQEWLSTGQAARVCFVKPDTILKWIKRGKLKARRTPGGHYRIHHRDLEILSLTPHGNRQVRGPDDGSYAQHLRCWEYMGTGASAPEDCRRCIVYRSRAAWCFQLADQAVDVGHSRRFCSDSCEECSYYQRVRGLAPGILVVTADGRLINRVKAREHPELRIRFARSPYEASAIIQDFRPDFVVIDHDLLRGAGAGFLDDLTRDQRLPGVRLILAVGRGRSSRVKAVVERDSLVGVIEKPFGTDRIASVVDAFPVETRAPDEEGDRDLNA